MWFGTRAYMQEVSDPAPEPEFPSVGWGVEAQYLNGGLGVASSANSHREYLLSWEVMERAEVRKITDYADRVYGDGLIYWLDPVSIDQNVLPQAWATPGLAVHDAVPVVGDSRPVSAANTDFSQGYPAESAVYTVTGSSVTRSVFIPIPPGHVAWVGVHGLESAEGFVKVTPFTGSTPGAGVYPTILSVATPTRVNTSIGSGATGLELSVDVSSLGAEEEASFTWNATIVQILPDGVMPDAGGFVSGQGHSGCRFMGRPVAVPYGTAANLVSVSVKLGEVGQWLT